MFGRATIRISTGQLIEFQSGDPNTDAIIQNAINAGINSNDIEIRNIQKEEELKALLPIPVHETTQLEQDIAAITDPQLKNILERLRRGILI